MTARRLFTLFIGFLFAVATLPSSPVEAQERDAPGDIVVTLEPGASVEAIAAQHGAEVVESIPGTTTYRLRAPKARKTLKTMKQDNAVRRANRDNIVRRQQTVSFPNDDPALLPSSSNPHELFANQISETGQLESLQVDSASALAESAEEITIAVLDTGLDLTHPTVSNRLWWNRDEIAGNGLDDDRDGYVDNVNGWDFVGGTSSPDESTLVGPISGHGTFISGLILLTAPKARIMPLRVLGTDGVGSAFDAAAAVNFAAQNGARVISMSFGADGGAQPKVLREAISSARELGVVLVAAVGNGSSSQIAYPAADSDRVISVGATDTSQKKADFSNYAEEAVDVWAPGVDLVSAMPGRYEDGSPRYAVWSGTSFSTALVAAACSLLLSTSVVSDPDEVKERIVSFGPSVEGVTGNQVNFFESVGSILRDSGALDVWSTAPLFEPTDTSSAGGYILLRTIGQAQRLTAYAWGLSSYGNYDFYVAPLRDDASAVKVNVDGPIKADQFGNVKFVAARDAQPGDSTPLLPIPLDLIGGVAFVNASTSAIVRIGTADSASGLVGVWAGVGMTPVGYPDPYNSPFGRAWLAFDPGSGYQNFNVASCSVEPHAEYALWVNGAEVARSKAWDDGNGYGSIVFYFSSDPGEVAEDGAIELSVEATPGLVPITRVKLVELKKVEQDGSLRAIIACSFSSQDPLLRKFRQHQAE